MYAEFIDFFKDNIAISKKNILQRMKQDNITTREEMSEFVSTLLMVESAKNEVPMEHSFFDDFLAGNDNDEEEDEEEEEEDEEDEDEDEDKDDNENEDKKDVEIEDKKEFQTHHYEDEDDESNDCLLCCEPLKYVAIGSCNHASICANCTIRQRVLYKNRACSLCKTEMEHFIVTSDVSRLKYELWSEYIFGDMCGGRLVSHTISDGFFDTKDAEYMKSVEQLLGYHCGHCNDRSSNSVAQLQKHLNVLHELQLCQICIDTGRFFVSELSRFNKGELENHIENGQPKEGLKLHPLCTFCKPKRCYDEEQLYYHMIHDHFQCDVCRSIGNGNRFFQKYENLNEHFHDLHYPCEQESCVLNRYVVFESEIDLKGHMATNHPHVKFDRNIVVNFTVGRGGGSSSGGNNNRNGGEMTFSDDFMRYGSSNSPPIISSNNNYTFPTLQEQEQEQRRGSKSDGETKGSSSLSSSSSASSSCSSSSTIATAAALDFTLHAFNTKDENWECTICTMSDEEQLEIDVTFVHHGFQLSCAHGYHTQCLSEWINTKNKNRQPPTCPNCRNDITAVMCDAVLQRQNKYLTDLKKEQQKIQQRQRQAMKKKVQQEQKEREKRMREERIAQEERIKQAQAQAQAQKLAVEEKSQQAAMLKKKKKQDEKLKRKEEMFAAKLKKQKAKEQMKIEMALQKKEKEAAKLKLREEAREIEKKKQEEAKAKRKQQKEEEQRVLHEKWLQEQKNKKQELKKERKLHEKLLKENEKKKQEQEKIWSVRRMQKQAALATAKAQEKKEKKHARASIHDYMLQHNVSFEIAQHSLDKERWKEKNYGEERKEPDEEEEDEVLLKKTSTTDGTRQATGNYWVPENPDQSAPALTQRQLLEVLDHFKN